jgi:hypothetical protein
MEPIEAMSKIIERYPHNEEKDFHFIYDLASKYPDFKILNILILNFPVDLFFVELWNKAELYKQNYGEIIEIYYPKSSENPNKNQTEKEFLNREQLLNKQNEAINKFLSSKKDQFL